ncbi:MAG: mechanosensitive ion channel [Desulfobacterales bacterium]
MQKSTYRVACLMLLTVLLLAGASGAAAPPSAAAVAPAASAGDSPRSASGGVVSTREDVVRQIEGLAQRTPLGWHWETVEKITRWGLSLPARVMAFVVDQGRLLGVLGSLVVLLLMLVVFYSLIGHRRVLQRAEAKIHPLLERLPAGIIPYCRSALRVVVASLIPLLLLGMLTTANAFIHYRAPWYLLAQRLLALWALGALLKHLLREMLAGDLLPVTARYGKTLYRLARLGVFYVLVGVAVVWGAAAFGLPADVLALIQFVIALSIVLMVTLLLLNKTAILSLVPDLPYPIFKGFRKLFDRIYHPLVFLTFLAGLLWCFGYRRFAWLALQRTWGVIGVFILVMLAYHLLRQWIQRQAAQKDLSQEDVAVFFRAMQSLLLYVAVVTMVVVTFGFIGTLGPLRTLMSIPLPLTENTAISLWVVLKAGVLLASFFFLARLLEAYLDYRIYPALGIDPGLAYALNTFFKYLIIALGVFISLHIVGLDLRVLMVFAGAIGVGIGFGLQSMAANLISGFTLIFGGTVRRGDWIQVGDTVGVVTDIFLRATRVKTRDNVEYLIPNSEFVSSTIVNFTLSSAMIRISIPVGVSYDADPHRVRDILLECARNEPLAGQFKTPQVRFTSYGESSIDFELLIWIDARKVARRRIRSRLYFAIFAALKEAGIEIPFPQRDLHLRSGFGGLAQALPTAAAQS